MGLRDIGATLPPGFRFYPSDEELVCHYLLNKITNEDVLKGTLVEIDLHTCEPWQLPEVAKLNANEWYFFSFRDRKYATGFRTNRATTSGYWKATGKDRMVLDPITREIVGMRKTLVFYRNRAPNGVKTGWIMHEFRLETPHMPPKEDWVLCRVFHKSKGVDDHHQNNSNKYDPHFIFDSTATSVSLADHHSLPCGYQHQIPSLSSSPTPPHHHHHHHHHQHDQNSLINLLQLSQQEIRNNSNPIITSNTITAAAADISSKGENNGGDFGFLWDDLNLEAGDSSLENIRFEIGNSMVFL